MSTARPLIDFLLLRPFFTPLRLQLLWFGYLIIVGVEITTYAATLLATYPTLTGGLVIQTAAWLLALLVRLALVRVLLEVAVKLISPSGGRGPARASKLGA